MGSVVISRPHGSSGLLIVDGQQRLITLCILLAALRDSDAWLPSNIRTRIDKALWLPKPKTGVVYRRLRVLPTQFDQDAFARILLNSEEIDSPVSSAYRYFGKRVRDLLQDEAEDEEDYSGLTVEEVARSALSGLECVLVTAEQGDNAHRIFESLNNKGADLSQADLIRNYVLMRIDRNQEDFYEFTFKPLEGRFTPQQLTQLFWLDLILSGDDATQRQTYARQQQRMEGMTRQELEDHFGLLTQRADLFERILNPEREKSNQVRLRLERIRQWGTTTAAPTLMYLLECRRNGTASVPEVARAMHYLESYFVRRVVMGRATMNMNRILMDAPAALEKSRDPVDQALREHLSGTQKYWASDNELRRNAASKPFYRHGRAHQRILILRWLEEAIHNDDPEFALADELSLEHVMPQTLTDSWREELKAGLQPHEKVGKIHAELVDTLGNLTLMTYKLNSALSNRPFSEKKALLKAKGGGRLALTQQITSRHHWRPANIRRRSDQLVELIIENWPGPIESDDTEP